MSDLEYDLAHEAMGGPTDTADRASTEEQRPSVYVPTQTKDYDGDYGYDLAHDVPGR
jgi:hypothetical protein